MKQLYLRWGLRQSWSQRVRTMQPTVTGLCRSVSRDETSVLADTIPANHAERVLCC